MHELVHGRSDEDGSTEGQADATVALALWSPLLDAARLAGRTHPVTTPVRRRRRCRPRALIPVNPAAHLRAVASHSGPARWGVVQACHPIDAGRRSWCRETHRRERQTRCHTQEPNCHTAIPRVCRNNAETLRQHKLTSLVPQGVRPLGPIAVWISLASDVSRRDDTGGHSPSGWRLSVLDLYLSLMQRR